MPDRKSQRIAEDIRREIVAIIREMKDPRLQDDFISVIKTDVSSDKSSCRVFVSAMKGIEKSKQAVQALKSAEGHIRTELGKRLRLRYIPNIRFQETDAIEKGVNLYKKIENIATKEIKTETSEDTNEK